MTADPFIQPDGTPPPWDHQLRFYEFTRDLEYAALFLEQRTGKSRIIVATAAYLHSKRLIDGVLIFAPNGVSGNWLAESIPQFMPRQTPYTGVLWRSGKMTSKGSQASLAELLNTPLLSVLSVNYDAMRLVATKAYLAKFLRKRKLLIVFDESDDLGVPSSKRTTVATHAAKWGKYRRILTGTPASESPFSLYSQTNLLKPRLLGFSSFLTFKHRYAKYEDEKGYNHNTGIEYDQICRDEDGRPIYQNLDELSAKLAPFSVRITRVECGTSLPTYVPRRFELEGKQRDAYNALREQFRLELETADTVTAAQVLQRYTRLQQITSGYVPLDRPPQACPTCDGTDDSAQRARALVWSCRHPAWPRSTTRGWTHWSARCEAPPGRRSYGRSSPRTPTRYCPCSPRWAATPPPTMAVCRRINASSTRRRWPRGG